MPVPATLPSPPFSRTTRSRRGTTTSTSTVGKRGRTIGDGNGNGSGNSNGNGHIRTAKLPSVPRVIGEERINRRDQSYIKTKGNRYSHRDNTSTK